MSVFLINASNLSKGGGAQIAIWLIDKLFNEVDIDIKLAFLVSPYVWEGIKHNDYNADRVYIIDSSPVRSLRARRKVKEIVANIKPSVVYTLYGPSGITFDCLEISGVANAWISCAKLKDFFSIYKVFAPIEMLKYYMHGISLRKKNYLVFETDFSRQNFCERYGYDLRNTRVIPNTVNNYFLSAEITSIEMGEVFNILYVSAYYKHKNIEMLPFYALALKKSGKIKKFVFQLTLPDKDFQSLGRLIERLGVQDIFVNLGVLSGSELPAVYQKASLVISPSSIETFSATYAEAIYLERYLAVADKGFSREICKQAALYFDPFNVGQFIDLAEGVYMGTNTEPLQSAFKHKDDLFITPDVRFEMIRSLLLDFSATP